jgi:hypothetical protein
MNFMQLTICCPTSSPLTLTIIRQQQLGQEKFRRTNGFGTAGYSDETEEGRCLEINIKK